MCSVCFIRGSYTSWFQVSVTSTNSNNLWVSVLWQNHASCVGSNQKNTPRTQGIRLPNTYDKSRDCFEFLAIQPMVHCPWNYRCFCPLSSQYCLAQQTIRVFCSQDTFFVLHDLQQLPQGDENLARVAWYFKWLKALKALKAKNEYTIQSCSPKVYA